MMSFRKQAGFTLLETILSLALVGLIVGMLSTIGKQWLVEWNIGSKHVEKLDRLELARDRLVSDLQLALDLPMTNETLGPNFTGDADHIIFVREPLSGDGTDRLLFVLYNNDQDRGVIRRIAPYDGMTSAMRARFGEPVGLLPSSYHIAFGYRGFDGQISANWREAFMPSEIIVELRNGNAEPISTFSIAPHVQIPFSCAALSSVKDCQFFMRGEKAPGPAQNFLGQIKSVIKGPGSP